MSMICSQHDAVLKRETEFALANTAETSPRPADASAHVAEIVFPDHLNHHGTYFGGYTLALMSRSALVAATRVAKSDVVLARCHEVDFRQPAYVGELVEATARVERVGNRSMTVAVEVTAEDEDRKAARGGRRPLRDGYGRDRQRWLSPRNMKS
jgi:acyl-CoA hydrolase